MIGLFFADTCPDGFTREGSCNKDDKILVPTYATATICKVINLNRYDIVVLEICHRVLTGISPEAGTSDHRVAGIDTHFFRGAAYSLYFMVGQAVA